MRRAMKVLSGVVFATAISGLTWSCTDHNTSEPVAADDKAPKVPDVPGAGSGEGKEKAAGTGSAGSGDTAVEKSTPDTEAAEKAAKGKKGKKGGGAAGAAMPNLKPGDATVDSDLVNVRSTGSMTASVVKKLKKGDKVTIKECKLGWCEIGAGEFVGAKMLKQ